MTDHRSLARSLSSLSPSFQEFNPHTLLKLDGRTAMEIGGFKRPKLTRKREDEEGCTHRPTDRTTEHFPESADGRTPATDRSEPGLVPVLARRAGAGGRAGRRQLKRPHTRPSLPVRPSVYRRRGVRDGARARRRQGASREGGPRHRIMPAGPRTADGKNTRKGTGVSTSAPR